MRSRRKVLALVVLAAALAGAGFAAGSLAGDDDGGKRRRGRAVVPGAVSLAPVVTTASGIRASAPVSQDVFAEQRVVRTAELTIEVDGAAAFESAWDGAFGLAKDLGGLVLGSSRTRAGAADEAPLTGHIQVRVPVDSFEEALRRLRGLGTVRAEGTTSRDVTEEVVDLRARLRQLRAEEDALIRLLDRAESVSDILAIQRRLSSVQSDIERTADRLRFLDTRTEFSLIDLALAEEGAELLETDEGPSLERAVDTGVGGLERIGHALLIAAIWAGPFLAVLLLALGIWRVVRPRPSA